MELGGRCNTVDVREVGRWCAGIGGGKRVLMEE